MKWIYFMLIWIVCLNIVVGQNLVPNPSFEDTLDCPVLQDQIGYAAGWSNYGGSPDYFNSCSPSWSEFTVPTNWGGYQFAATGNAYCAIGTYAPCCPSNREFIGAPLSNPLTVGIKYFVSFKVCLSLADNIQAYMAANKTGVKFTSNSYTWSSPPPLNNFAHVYTNSIITDSVNWTTINGSFVADSSYQYIVLGNFYDDSNTDTISFVDSTFRFAYYYIDDVCVSTDSLTCIQTIGINTDTKKSNFKVYPNPTKRNATLEFDNSMNENCILKIYDRFGLLIQIIENIQVDKVEIEREDWPAGLYFFQLQTKYKIIAIGKLTFD